MLLNFYLNKNILFDKNIVQKSFSKYIYTKFLILAFFQISKSKSTLYLDSYYLEFSFVVKKKIKRLNYLSKIKTGKFLKCNIFIYQHSKLTSIFFFSIRFNTYIKKKIYFSLNKLKFILQQLKLVFIYKNIRGGFLGFSNNILGFFSKKYFLKLKELKSKLNIVFYKKYCIFFNILSCLPYKYTNYSSFFFFNSGHIRTFQKIKKKKTLRRFFFKRFKFFFLIPFFILKKKILYFKNNFLKLLTYKSSFFFNFIFKFFFILLISNKKKFLNNKFFISNNKD